MNSSRNFAPPRRPRFLPAWLGLGLVLTLVTSLFAAVAVHTGSGTMQVAAEQVLAEAPAAGAGPRVALLVGISDYPGTDDDLAGGPLNDVTLMSDLLTTRLGFAPRDILTLTDAEATTSNIISAFLTRLAAVPPGGVVVFYYSGHGSQFPDQNQEESDSLDEVLVIRGDSAGSIDIIRDDDLSLLASVLKAKRVLFILDNCYSGTGTRGVGSTRTLASVAGDRAANLPLRIIADSLNRTYLPKRIPTSQLGAQEGFPTSAFERAITKTVEPTNHLLIAASAENELSLNIPLRLDDGSKVSVGLLTSTLYLSLNSGNLRTTTFTALIGSLRTTTKSVAASLGLGPQTPQVEGTAKGQAIATFLLVP